VRSGPSSEAFGALACRLEAFSAWSETGAERDRRPRNDLGTTHLGARHRITSFPVVAACGPDRRAPNGLQPSRTNLHSGTPERCCCDHASAAGAALRRPRVLGPCGRATSAGSFLGLCADQPLAYPTSMAPSRNWSGGVISERDVSRSSCGRSPSASDQLSCPYLAIPLQRVVCERVGIDLARIAPALVAVSREQAHAGERRHGSGLWCHLRDAVALAASGGVSHADAHTQSEGQVFFRV
jgi:hypothetical protein